MLRVSQYTTGIDVPIAEREFLDQVTLPEFSDIEAIDINALTEVGDSSTS